MTIPTCSAGLSTTAILAAASRAVGTRDPDARVRNPDWLAEPLLKASGALALEHPHVRAVERAYRDAMTDVDVAGSVAMLMVRTKFHDACLLRSLEGGAEQVVFLGAGLDTRAHRFAGLLADVAVFEVDRPETQDMKRHAVATVLGRLPSNVTYVPANLHHESLGHVLAARGYEPRRRTCFIAEGLTMYLPEAAVGAILAFVGAQAGGSVIAMDYVYRPVVEVIPTIDVMQLPTEQRAGVQRFLDMIAQEPFRFGLPLDGEREYLRQFGLELRDVLPIGGPEAARRYLTRADGTTVAGGGEEVGRVYKAIEAVVR